MQTVRVGKEWINKSCRVESDDSEIIESGKNQLTADSLSYSLSITVDDRPVLVYKFNKCWVVVPSGLESKTQDRRQESVKLNSLISLFIP